MLSWQPAVRLDYQPMQKLRASFKYSAWKQRDQVFLGTIPGFNDTRMQNAPVVQLHDVGELHAQPDDVPRGDLRAQPERAGGLRAGAVGDRRDLLQQRRGTAGVHDHAVCEPGRRRAVGTPVPVPERHRPRPRATTPSRRSTRCQPAVLGRQPGCRRCRRSSGAAASPTRRRRIGFPGWLNINSTNDFAISLTKVKGRAHDQDRLLQHPQLQGGADEQRRVRHDQLRAGHADQPVDTSFGFSNAAIGTFASFQQAKQYVETDVDLQQRRVLRPGQLEGEQPAHARLRSAVRAPGRAVRPPRGRRRTSCPDKWSRWRRRRRSTCRAAPTARTPARATTVRR